MAYSWVERMEASGNETACEECGGEVRAGGLRQKFIRHYYGRVARAM